MANLIRSAKSAKDWTRCDLDAYNIHIRLEDSATFFGIQDLPHPNVDQEILDVQDAENMVSARNAELVNLLDIAMAPVGTSAVNDFAMELFKRTGYTGYTRVARSHMDTPLLICGEWRNAQTDVCILDRQQNDIVLLHASESGEPLNPEAHLVAEAIAAFDQNNRIRGAASIDAKVVPGIIMVDTSPTFFKIPVTFALVHSVRHGLFPPEPTIISAHVPVIPRPYRKGMKSLDTRVAILQCYEAFKAIVGI
ncbi:hypothetical protein DFS33DRAFT_201161 [Desarmillaria ectypa]|nr:hypothetical protein DFS33DRAFT_201161 [Desarmillaria ectypa]